MRDRVLTAVAVLAMAVWAFRPLWDVDVWWHLATGHWILAQGVPLTDVFSAADPQAPWVTFQWGYQVALALLENAGGLRLVQLAHVALLATAAGVVTASLRRTGLSRPMVLGALGLMALLIEDRVRCRPHLVEVVAVATLIPVLVEGRRLQGEGQWALPERTLGVLLVLGGAVWANLHAVSALWWVALVGCWVVNRPSLERAAVWGGGVLAMAASPWVRHGLIGALTSHSEWPVEFVPELQHTWVYASGGLWGWSLLLGVGLGLAAAAHLAVRSELPWGARLAALGCAVAAAWMARWVYFAVVPLGLWVAVNAWKGVPWLGLAAALGATVHVAPRWSVADRMQVIQPDTFPEAACQDLRDHGFLGPMDTSTQWSGYLLWCLQPDGRVLGDGRLVFGPEVAELLRARNDGDVDTFDTSVQRYHTWALVWPTQSAPPLNPGRWRLVHDDPVAQIWVPRPMWGAWKQGNTGP